MNTYRIENAISGVGFQFIGTLLEAIREAHTQCTTDTSRWVVWTLPDNNRVASVTIRGATVNKN